MTIDVFGELTKRYHAGAMDLLKTSITLCSGALFLMPLAIANLEEKVWLFSSAIFFFIGLTSGWYSMALSVQALHKAAKQIDSRFLFQIVEGKPALIAFSAHHVFTFFGIVLFITALGLEALNENEVQRCNIPTAQESKR